MALSYTKEFLVNAFYDRYKHLPDSQNLRQMADTFYDKVGKEKFRVYCSLDAAAVKEYKNTLDR